MVSGGFYKGSCDRFLGMILGFHTVVDTHCLCVLGCMQGESFLLIVSPGLASPMLSARMEWLALLGG